MRCNSKPCHRAIAAILLLNIWLVTGSYSGISAQTSSPGEQGNGAKEQRFETFKKNLQKSIDTRIANLEKWIYSDPNSRFAPVAASMRGPMVERLEQIRDQFVKELDQEPQSTTIRAALNTDDSITPQVKIYFQKVDDKLTERYNKSQVELTTLLGTSLLEPKIETMIKYTALGAFALLTLGIGLMIFKTNYRDGKTQTIRLGKETVYLSVALAVIYLILLLALLDYLVNQRIQGYLAVGFASMVILYFGSRAAEALYNFTSGFSFIKTFPDGTREKIKNYEHSNVISGVNELNSKLTNELRNFSNMINQIQKREQEGWSFVQGNIKFPNDQIDKSGVKIILEPIQGEFHTDKDGDFLIPDVRPGTYTLKAEKPGFRTHSEGVKVPFRDKAQLSITMAPN